MVTGLPSPGKDKIRRERERIKKEREYKRILNMDLAENWDKWSDADKLQYLIGSIAYLAGAKQWKMVEELLLKAIKEFK